jgi:hypothetical protein
MKFLITGAVFVFALFSIWIVLTNPLLSRNKQRSLLTSRPATLQKHVRELSKLRRGAESGSGLNEAKHYLEREWSNLGLTLVRQTYAVNKKPFSNLSVAFGPVDAPTIIVGAHYDTFGGFPGADDNASGVAALLELSEMLVQYKSKLPYRIELVAFTLEEPPYFDTRWMGSIYHARAVAQKKTPVKAMVSLEMVGFFTDQPHSQSYPWTLMKVIYPDRGNFIGVVGNLQSWSLTRRFKQTVWDYTDLTVASFNAPEKIEGVDYSDQRSYWAYGFPAIMVTDTSFFRNPNYHTEQDNAETLNFEKMAQVVEAVFSFVVQP